MQIPLDYLVQISNLSLLQGEILDEYIGRLNKLNEYNLINGKEFIDKLIEKLDKEKVLSIAKIAASVCLKENNAKLRTYYLQLCT